VSVLDNNTTANLARSADGRVMTATVGHDIEPIVATPPDAMGADVASVERTFEPIQFGAYTPEKFGRPQGNFGGAVSAGWRDGILGWITRSTFQDPAERDRIIIEGANYADAHGVRNFLGGVIGGAASDAPIEIGLILAGGPLLGSLAKSARNAGRVGTAKRLQDAADTMRLAEAGDVRLLTRAKYNASMGALAGIISEYSQQGLGKEGNFEDVLERATQDAVGSVVFGEVIRAGVKLYKMSRKKAEAQVRDDLKSTFTEDQSTALAPYADARAFPAPEEGVVDPELRGQVTFDPRFDSELGSPDQPAGLIGEGQRQLGAGPAGLIPEETGGTVNFQFGDDISVDPRVTYATQSAVKAEGVARLMEQQRINEGRQRGLDITAEANRKKNLFERLFGVKAGPASGIQVELRKELLGYAEDVYNDSGLELPDIVELINQKADNLRKFATGELEPSQFQPTPEYQRIPESQVEADVLAREQEAQAELEASNEARDEFESDPQAFYAKRNAEFAETFEPNPDLDEAVAEFEALSARSEVIMNDLMNKSMTDPVRDNLLKELDQNQRELFNADADVSAEVVARRRAKVKTEPTTQAKPAPEPEPESGSLRDVFAQDKFENQVKHKEGPAKHADSTRLSDDIEAKIAQGEGTLGKLINFFKDATDRLAPNIGKFMDRLIALNPELANLKVKLVDGLDSMGSYLNNVVTLRKGMGDADMSETFGHEVLHGALDGRLQQVLDSTKKKDKAIADRIHNLRDIVMKHVVKNPSMAASNIGKNVEEFLAEAVSNPRVQKILKEIKIDKKQTAWTKFVSWVKDLLGWRKDPDNELDQLLEDVLDIAGRKQGVKGPTAKKAEDRPRIASPEKRQRRTKSQKTKDREQAQKTQARGKKQVNDIQDDHHRGSWMPKTKWGQRFWKAIRKLPSMFGSGNFTAIEILKGLGPEMRMVVERMKRDQDFSKGTQVDMTRAMQELDLGPEQHAMLKKESTVKIGGKAYRMNGYERMALYMSLTDGTDLDFKWNGALSSGYGRIVKQYKDGKLTDVPGVTIKEGRDPVKLTPAEAWDLAVGGRLLSAEELKWANHMQGVYAKNVPWMNQVYKKLTGDPLIPSEGKYRYSPLRSAMGEGEDGFDDILSFSDLLGRGKSDPRLKVAGSLKQRGQRPLVLSDPFETMTRYIDAVPEAVAHAEQVKIAMDALGAFEDSPTKLRNEVKKTMGNDMYKSLITQLKNYVGDRSGLKGPSSPLIGRLISIANMSKLAFPNVGTPLKQWGSIWTAQASKILPNLKSSSDSMRVWADATKMWASKKTRERLLDEAQKAVPLFAHRQLRRVAFLDDEALTGDDFAKLMLTSKGEPSVMQLLKLAKDKKVNRTQAWAELVSRGLFMIKIMDESAMAALWKATKESGLSKDKWNDAFRDLIIETQPSYDKLSRSMNQLNRDELSRTIHSFTSQTRINAFMTIKSMFDYFNKPKRTADDFNELLDVLGPMFMQTVYATAAGTGAAMATGTVLGLVEDDAKQARNEQLRKQNIAKVARRFARDLVGQVQGPVGALTSYIAARLTGSPAFEMGITPYSDVEELLSTVTNKEGEITIHPESFMRAFGGLFGSRSLGQLGASALPSN